MRVITIQDGNFFRVALVPESPADQFMLTAMRKAEGSKARVIPVETSQIAKVINPYRDLALAQDESKDALLLEMEIANFPTMVEAVQTRESQAKVPDSEMILPLGVVE
jgi:hypothetical protein